MKKWKPKADDRYFFILLQGYEISVEADVWENCMLDEARWDLGLVFRTRKQAQQMAKKIKEMLKGMK